MKFFKKIIKFFETDETGEFKNMKVYILLIPMYFIIFWITPIVLMILDDCKPVNIVLMPLVGNIFCAMMTMMFST